MCTHNNELGKYERWQLEAAVSSLLCQMATLCAWHDQEEKETLTSVHMRNNILVILGKHIELFYASHPENKDMIKDLEDIYKSLMSETN